MPVNLLITISLIGALVLVLLKRRSLAAKGETAPKDRARSTGSGRSRFRRNRTERAEAPTLPRMRPRLAMTVTSAETVSPEVAPVDAEPEPAVEMAAPMDVPVADVPDSLWDDTEPDVDAPAVADPVPPMPILDDPSALVDAPGWPSPGELVGMFALDDFDPVPPAIEDPTDPQALSDVTDSGHDDLWRDLDDTEEPRADLPVEAWGRNPYPDEHQVEPALVDAPVATLETVTWDTVAESSDVETVSDAERPEWASDDWSFEGQDEVGHSSSWTAPDPADDAPAVVADAWDAHAAGEPRRDDDATAAEWSSLSEPAPVAFTTEVPAPILANAMPNPTGQAPVVVVLTPEMLNLGRPSARERELERTVRRLEKQVAALTAAAPVASTPRRTTPTRATPARRSARSATTSTAPFSLTAAELAALRALAARRSAPLAARNRARIIMRSARGLATATIAKQVGVSASTVRRWQARFAVDRLAALGSDIRPAGRATR